jgi:hypothetical protein
MADFLATLSVAAGNRAICKRHGLWGAGTSSHADFVERELSLEPFIDMRGRVRLATGDELAAELQRRFPEDVAMAKPRHLETA